MWVLAALIGTAVAAHLRLTVRAQPTAGAAQVASGVASRLRRARFRSVASRVLRCVGAVPALPRAVVNVAEGRLRGSLRPLLSDNEAPLRELRPGDQLNRARPRLPTSCAKRNARVERRRPPRAHTQARNGQPRASPGDVPHAGDEAYAHAWRKTAARRPRTGRPFA